MKKLILFFILLSICQSNAGLITHIIAYKVGQNSGKNSQQELINQKDEDNRRLSLTIDSLQNVIKSEKIKSDSLNHAYDSIMNVLSKKKVKAKK